MRKINYKISRYLRVIFMAALALCLLYAAFSVYFLYHYFKVDIEQNKILTAQEKKLKELSNQSNLPKGKYDVEFGILMYHHITNDPNYKHSRLTVSPEILDQQVVYLLNKGYQFLTLSQALETFAGNVKPNKKLVLTFDDGYRDFYEQAYPILKKYNAPATLFVINTDIGRAGNITSAMLKEMRDGGLVEIGAHTLNHPYLTKLKEMEAEKQILTSKLDLENMVGAAVRVLAYPFGAYNKRVVNLAKQAGYVGAVSVFFGEKPSADNIFVWRRVMVTNAEIGDNLLKKIYLAFSAAK